MRIIARREDVTSARWPEEGMFEMIVAKDGVRIYFQQYWEKRGISSETVKAEQPITLPGDWATTDEEINQFLAGTGGNFGEMPDITNWVDVEIS